MFNAKPLHNIIRFKIKSLIPLCHKLNKSLLQKQLFDSKISVS